MSTRISPDRSKSPGIAPEFIKNVEDELSRRLGQPVTLVLGDGIVAVRADGELFAGESVVVMDAGPLLPRKRAAEWADAFERKISRLSRRAADVEHLYAEIQKVAKPGEDGRNCSSTCRGLRRRLLPGARHGDHPRQGASSPQPGPQLRSASGVPAPGAQARPRWRDGRYVERTRPGRGAGERSWPLIGTDRSRPGDENSPLCPLPARGALFTDTARWSRRNSSSPARRRSRAHGKIASRP